MALEPTLAREIARLFKLATPLVSALNGAILGDADEDTPAPRRPLF
jgi:hypothetical protein